MSAMGEHNVEQAADERTRRTFMKALLDDVRALEEMVATGMIESGIRSIGAEQEMFLVDGSSRPSLSAMQHLEHLDDPPFTHEPGLLNLEANLTPPALRCICLCALEREQHVDTELGRK